MEENRVSSEQKLVTKAVEFEPSIWGDYFINQPHLPPTNHSMVWITRRITELIEKVKKILADAIIPSTKMQIIDALQRLGVDYHFEKEIDMELNQRFKNPDESNELHIISLQFRLFRQHGFHVSSDVFKKFKDDRGTFNAELAKNVKGLLSMYDASFLSTPQDEILDEAMIFAKQHLVSMASNLEGVDAQKVFHAMETPFFRNMRRLEARKYLSIYEEDAENRNDDILELAKLDFHLLQSMHRKEIKSISIWWKELGLASKMTFTRDRIAELYFWILGVYFEPQFSRARTMMMKVISFLSLTDDIFDSYGTFHDLQHYNQVIQRWDLEAVNQLDPIMQLHFLALDKTFKELEDELASEQLSYRAHFLKGMVQELANAYFEEARIEDDGRLISFDDYRLTSLKTSGYHVLSCASFVGMGEVATRQAFEWVTKFPEIVKQITIISRFMDDVGDVELDREESKINTTVNCYMNDRGISVGVACEELLSEVELAWKIINQEVINLKGSILMPLLDRIVNLARMMETMFRKSDGYTHPKMLEEYIRILLVEPIHF